MAEWFVGFLVSVGLFLVFFMALWSLTDGNQQYQKDTQDCASRSGVYVSNNGYPYCMATDRTIIARY